MNLCAKNDIVISRKLSCKNFIKAYLKILLLRKKLKTFSELLYLISLPDKSFFG